MIQLGVAIIYILFPVGWFLEKLFPVSENLEVINWKEAKEGNLFIRDYRSMNPLRKMMRDVKHAMITMEEEDRMN